MRSASRLPHASFFAHPVIFFQQVYYKLHATLPAHPVTPLRSVAPLLPEPHASASVEDAEEADEDAEVLAEVDAMLASDQAPHRELPGGVGEVELPFGLVANFIST